MRNDPSLGVPERKGAGAVPARLAPLRKPAMVTAPTWKPGGWDRGRAAYQAARPAVDDRSREQRPRGLGPAPYDAVLVQNIGQASGGGTNPPAL